MANFETRLGNPRILMPFRGEFIDLPYELDVDADTAQPDLAVSRSLNGSTEAQPTESYDMLRLQLEGVATSTKRALERLWDLVLTQGEPIEFYADSKRLFHLTGSEDYCFRTHRRPTGTYTKAVAIPSSVARADAIGVFGTSENKVKNGDFLDGTTDWTVVGSSLQISSQQYLPPSGTASRCLRIQSASASPVTDQVQQDIELSDQLDNIAKIGISFSYRSGRNYNTASTPLTVKLKAADGTGSTISVVTLTPGPSWDRYHAVVALAAGIGSTTDLTLRLWFECDAIIATGAIYIADVQIEEKSYCTGFIPKAATGSTRTATGTRSAAESMRFVNPLTYASQTPHYEANGPETPWSFTVACEYVSLWDEGASGTPYGNMYCWSMGQPGTPANEMAGVFITNTGVVSARVLTEDANSFVTATSNQTINTQTVRHIVLSWLDWDGTNANSGKLRLYVNGSLISTTNHSSWAASCGEFLWVGSDPYGTYLASGYLRHVIVDAVYIDGTTVVIGDYYSDSEYPDRIRTGWRAVLDPSQKGRPCRLKNNIYGLDLKLIESRMG